MTKTQLTVEVEYDPDVTDAESLAIALDCLLERGLSTPSIIEDHGDPTVGEFYVASEQLAVAATLSDHQQVYHLVIDGVEFTMQRRLLLKLIQSIDEGLPLSPDAYYREVLEGLVNLTDEIADQAHDNHGIDCLLFDFGDGGDPDANQQQHFDEVANE